MHFYRTDKLSLEMISEHNLNCIYVLYHVFFFISNKNFIVLYHVVPHISFYIFLKLSEGVLLLNAE
jgi:hypothetical protein